MAKFGRAGNGPVPPPAPGALERLKVLEGKVKELEGFRAEIMRAVRQTFAAVEQRLQNLEEVNEAVVSVVGRQAVEDEVKRLHIARVEAKAEMEEKALEAALKDGKVKEAEAIGDMSVVIGSEVDKDGNKLYPSRVQLLFATLEPEYQGKMRGAKAGDMISTPLGSKFTIVAVYDIIPGAERAQPAEAQPVVVANPDAAEGEPLSPEAEALLVEGLAEAAEQIESEKAQIEEQLVEDLAGNAPN